MKRQDFIKAVKLARSPNFQAKFFDPVFSGFALDNKRIIVTLDQVASLLVENCATFNGGWLIEEQDYIETLSKRFDLI